MAGTLVMAGNHLGNPLDMPPRSLTALSQADLIVFEEDRTARQTLKLAGLHRPYILFSEHRQMETLSEIRTALRADKTVYYMSDHGMPNVADPGKEILILATQLNCRVRVIPGPSSITCALAACTFDCQSFHFLGFLPREEHSRASTLRRLGDSSVAVVILETPYRVKNVLQTCVETLPSSRQMLLAIDIGGEQEEYLRGAPKSILTQFEQKFPEKLRLNCVLVVAGTGNRR